MWQGEVSAPLFKIIPATEKKAQKGMEKGNGYYYQLHFSLNCVCAIVVIIIVVDLNGGAIQ